MVSNHTFSALSIVRSSRSKQSRLPVYLRITVDGKRSEISTKEYVELGKWSREKGRVIGNGQEARSINQRLDEWENKVRDMYTRFIRDEKRIDSSVLKDAVLGIADKNNDLLNFFSQHEKEVGLKVGIEYSLGTHKNYIATHKHLTSYIEDKYKGRIISLKELDYAFITGFETYLKLNKDNSNNGALKHIRIKKVVGEALKCGKLDKNPFMSYKAKKEKINREYLSKYELQQIETVDLKEAHLQRVRDIFIFICYTGLSYSDLAELSEDDVVNGIDGGKWIYIERNKTKTVTKVPLLPPAMNIMDKYSDDVIAKSKEVLLPIISNQKMNKYLKAIAEICKIRKNITCHIGRHTFATTVTLSNDIPIETVSSMLGHTSLRTTQIYAKVIEKKISSDMSKLKQLYSDSPILEDNASNQ